MPDKPLSLGVGITFAEAIQAAEHRGVVLPEVYYGELQGLARQLAFSIAGVAAYDQLAAVKEALDVAIAQGQTFQKWKKEAAVQALELPKYRLDNIFRTNIQSNYQRGHWQKFQETKRTAPYLMYDAINDARVRHSHLALDGVIRPVDDPFWDTHAPLNGYRCRCTLIPLSEKQALARSGGGNGLMRKESLAMKPDNGWDYNPGENPNLGIKNAIAQRRIEAKIPKVFGELETKLKQLPGKPVADALELPRSGKTRATALDVLRAIESVHGDGELPRIPLRTSSSQSFQGAYSYYPYNGKANDIKLSTVSMNPELTIAHEIGHFIDHQGIGEKGKYASTTSPLFSVWRKAIDESAATQRIRKIAVKEGSSRAVKKNCEYYLSPWEQWARSYAQWLALRSNNEKMITQFKAITSSTLEPYSSSQWFIADFEPIADAIDNIFRSLGWLNE